MISISATATNILTRSYGLRCRMESWLGDELLSDAIPLDELSGANEETDRSLRVPERVTFTVPRLHRGEDWSPVDEQHPLAANGQRIKVELGIEIGGGQIEWFQRGWFVIHESDTDGDRVNVAAVGLLTLVDEARLVSPYQPTGTLASTLRGLIEPALTVVIDSGLTDRAVPSGINYDEDRLGAVMELLDAWGADAEMTEEGYLLAAPMGPSLTPVLSLTNGTGGTIIKASGTSTRENAWNVVVARGTATDGGQVQGVAYDSTGAKRYGGPFNPLAVPYFYASPLLTTAAQCQVAAATVLSRLKRSTSREFTIEMVPHPALQTGDTIDITTDGYEGLAVVETLRLPYMAGGGAGALRVRAI